MHCSQDPQVLFSAKITLKLGPTALFTHLKIILLQFFQFSALSGIQQTLSELKAFVFEFDRTKGLQTTYYILRIHAICIY